MKKYMMGMFILLFVVAVSCVGSVKRAEAFAFGSAGSTHLQGALDGITVGGPSSINVLTDEIADANDSTWELLGSGASISTIVIELAGYANVNKFGVYDVTNGGATKVELFGGINVQGDTVSFGMKADGSVLINSSDTGTNFGGTNVFGFYLESGNGHTYFSDTSLNHDSADHMAAYQGVGDQIQIPTLFAGDWTSSEYILAWEDLAMPAGDGDFADFVVMVESVQPVPEPGTIALLGLGLAGLVGVGARRRAKKNAA